MLSSRRSALGPSRGGIVPAATRISRVPARDLKHLLPAVTDSLPSLSSHRWASYSNDFKF